VLLSLRRPVVEPDALAVPLEPRLKVSGVGAVQESPVPEEPPERLTVNENEPLAPEGASTQR
jgi:hypothetical protein